MIPATTPQDLAEPTPAQRLLNKVPEVTLAFWAIKIMATTVGETAADKKLDTRRKPGAGRAAKHAQLMAGSQQVLQQFPPEKAGGACEGDEHSNR